MHAIVVDKSMCDNARHVAAAVNLDAASEGVCGSLRSLWGISRRETAFDTRFDGASKTIGEA